MTSTTPTDEIPERRSISDGRPSHPVQRTLAPTQFRGGGGTRCRGYDAPSFRPLALAGSPGRWEGTRCTQG